jgi:hypothetical protein
VPIGVKATGEYGYLSVAFSTAAVMRVPALRTAVRLWKPDLVRIDPLQGFAGCKIEDSEQIGNFLREG